MEYLFNFHLLSAVFPTDLGNELFLAAKVVGNTLGTLVEKLTSTQGMCGHNIIEHWYFLVLTFLCRSMILCIKTRKLFMDTKFAPYVWLQFGFLPSVNINL